MADDVCLEALRIDPGDPALVPARTTKRGGHKAGRYFVKVPLVWLEKLEGASGQTCLLALRILHLCFKRRSATITLTNQAPELDCMPSQSKRRSLRDLERRGIVEVEWRQKRSPIVHVMGR